MKQIILHLSVKNVQASIDFYTGILGFKIHFVQNDGKGNPAFVILRRDSIEIMIADTSNMQFTLHGHDRISASVLFYIEMDNLDEFYNEIKDKVNLTRPIEDTPWNTREFWITDIDNYNFSFFKNL